MCIWKHWECVCLCQLFHFSLWFTLSPYFNSKFRTKQIKWEEKTQIYFLSRYISKSLFTLFDIYFIRFWSLNILTLKKFLFFSFFFLCKWNKFLFECMPSGKHIIANSENVLDSQDSYLILRSNWCGVLTVFDNNWMQKRDIKLANDFIDFFL